MTVCFDPTVYLLQSAELCDRQLRSESTKADLVAAARVSDAALGRMVLAGRLMVRRVLQQRLGFDPTGRFENSFFAKPYLPGSGVHFNLSNSRRAAVLIVSRVNPCGVDIEDFCLTGPIHVRAKQFMSKREYDSFLGLRGSNERAWHLLEAWSRKEVFLKSLGIGRSFPSKQIEFDPPNCLQAGLWYSTTTGFAVRTFRIIEHAVSVCLQWEQMSSLRILRVSLDQLLAGNALEVDPTSQEPVAIRVLDTSLHGPFSTQGV